jgi:hypothetical protein
METVRTDLERDGPVEVVAVGAADRNDRSGRRQTDAPAQIDPGHVREVEIDDRQVRDLLGDCLQAGSGGREDLDVGAAPAQVAARGFRECGVRRDQEDVLVARMIRGGAAN